MDLIFSHFETRTRRTQPTSASAGAGVFDGSSWKSTNEGRAWHDSWCRFAELLPSPWHGELLLHASPEDASERVDQLAKAINDVLLRSALCLPCQGKWLPTSRSLDRFLPLIAIHNLFHRLVDTALGHNCCTGRGATMPFPPDSAFELAMLEEIA